MTRVNMLKVVALSALLATALITGCSENECSQPDGCVPDPALGNIWPNEDQATWTYDYVHRWWDSPGFTIYDDIDSVPPAPSLDDIAALLDAHPIGDSPQSEEGIYRLKFDGDTTTGPGVTAQNLTRMLVTEDCFDLLASEPAPRGAFLERFSPALTDTFDVLPDYPMFLRGGAWEKTGEAIVAYGAIDTLPNWKFLEANLAVGHEFTFEIISGGPLLHCRILRRLDFESGIGVLEKAIECLYMVDSGVLTFASEYGPIGWTRFFDYGIVVYAPTVGPVYSYERLLVQPGDTPSAGAAEITVSLIGASTP
ncbi:MAG: hypothetical protein ABIJ00_00320 [Candidatus Eisenbacteria bacterium]